MNDLFADSRKKNMQRVAPLAVRMRPRTLDEFVGQEHFLGKGKLLRRMLEADRLTDLLNACQELHLEDVEIASHNDGSTRSVEEFVISRDDLVAVHASGPAGDETMRQPTRTYPIAMQCGDYLIGGRIHVLP